MTWPTSRPGYPMHAWNGLPQNPERRGWHWLGFKGQHEQGREPWAWLWSDEDGAPGEFQWMTDDDGDPERMARQFTYLGPCYTQADLDAAVQAERVRAAKMLDDAASRHRTSAVKPSSIVESQAHELAAALLQLWANAIHMETDAPALDAALAQARRETWARAAEIAERVAIPEDCHGVEAHGRLMAAHAAADAIRSAAAGEEGK